MGIKCLLKFINETTDVVKVTNIEQYKYKRVAVDISLMMYKIIISVRNSGSDYTNQQGQVTSHILGLFNKTIEFLKNGIIPVYVFDGKPPELKNKVINDRRNVKIKAIEKMEQATTDAEKIKYFKKCVSISKQQWEQCKDLLNTMGIPWIHAPEEADSQCAYLSREGFVEAVLTDDMDILTFGSCKIIKNLLSKKNKPTEISLVNVLETLKLSLDEFIEFCILLGCDYCIGLTEIKQHIILEYYQKNRNIEKTLAAMRQDNIKVPKEINYMTTKKYFYEPNITKITKEDIILKKPQCDILLTKLVNDYGLIKNLVKNKVNKLNKYYEELKMI